MRAAKVQARLRGCAVSPEPLLLAHTSSESRGTFRQKARSLASVNDWACADRICHDGMLEDTNSHDAPQLMYRSGRSSGDADGLSRRPQEITELFPEIVTAISEAYRDKRIFLSLC